MVASNKHKVLSPSNLNIIGLSEDVSPDTASDYLAIYDNSAGQNKKVLLDNLGLGGGNAFTIMQPDLGTSPTATSQTDTLTYTSSDGYAKITGDSGAKSLDFTAPDTILVGTDGVVGAPAFSFKDKTNSGMYRVSNQIFFSANGVDAFDCSAFRMRAYLPFQTSNGLVSAPAYSFAVGQTNGGLYRNTTDNSLRMAILGVDAQTWQENYILLHKPVACIDATVVPLTAKGFTAQTANFFDVTDSADAKKFSIRADGAVELNNGPNGAAQVTAIGNVDIALDSTGKNGIATNGTGNNLAFFNNDVRVLYWTTSSCRVNIPFALENGTALAPVLSFAGDSGGGIWRDSGNDRPGFSVNGVNAQSWDDDFVAVYRIFGVGQFATGSLPTPASANEGFMAYDTTTQEIKFSDGSTWSAFGGAGGSGDVVGPASSIDNSIARFDSTTGKLLQGYTSNSPTITDAGVASFNNATYTQAEQIGALSVTSGTRATAFGNTAKSGASSVSIGTQSTATGTNSIAIGYLSLTTTSNSIAIGRSASAGTGGLAVGRNSSCSGTDSVAYGYSASCTGANAVAIGKNTLVSTQYGIGIGNNADSGSFAGINIGSDGILDKANQANLGGTTLGIKELVIGYGANYNNASIADIVYTVTSPITGTDFSGPDMILKGSGRTGSGTGGSVKVQTTVAGSTGTTQDKVGLDRIEATSEGEVVLNAEDNATPDATLWASSLSFYLDETGDTITVKAKYANGTTIKTGTIALT